MASRTQLRLSQVTGSFGTGAINDQIDAAATGSIATTDLQGVLSHLAGAIKRIHGQDSFSENTNPGEFAVTLQPATNDGAALGGASNNWSDLYLADGAVINFGDGQDVTLTHDGGTGLDVVAAGAFDITAGAASIIKTTAGDLTIDSDAARVILTGSSGADSVLVQSELTVSGDAIFSGNLTVNGTTTTVNSTTLTVDDAIILLGQGNNANTKDLGLILERGGSNIALFLDETDDVFKLGLTAEDASDDEITVADGVLTTQVDKLQITGSDHFISYENLGGGDTFNIKSSGDFLLDADGGKIMFTDTSAQSTDNIAFVIDIGTDQNTKFKDGNESIDFFTLDSANSRMDIDSTILIANGGNSTGGTITFLEDSDNGTNTSVLRGARSLANNDAVFELPADNGVNGYVLQTDGAGVTSWVAAGGNTVKTIVVITGSHAAENNLSLATADITAGEQQNALSTAESQGKTLDVFVNGQLLVSGAAAQIASPASRDYAITATNAIQFAFNLEIDDVVQVIKR